ncbi:bile acid:sodium symporter family protein [Novosphingobium sp.]|uniref:bile acid:sodium symporter family protein n=1 Tax=Novosphingobium sp. TaxID=1874826 RepID=UPI0033418F40
MRRSLSLPSVDPFLVWLVAVVTAASILPVRGGIAGWFGLATNLAVALLFFLHGAKLSRASILGGIGNWRLHVLVLGSTYVLFPLIGLATTALDGWLIDPRLGVGLLFLTLLPSTVQSSIAFTALARGNVAGAVCSASLSNLLGIGLTPLLVGLLLRTGGTGALSSWGSVQTIALQLLVPFVGGHLLRPLIGGWVDRNKAILQPVDRSSILLVVYTAFSAAVVNGIWTKVTVPQLGLLLVLSAVILGLVMVANVLVARLAGLPREDAIVLLFCGSKKSLVSGVPMAAALFAPATVGMVVLPLMIFHQLQLFACAALAGRFSRQANLAEAVSRIPQGSEQAAEAAAARGFTIPDACMPGVVANLALLGQHAKTLSGGNR